MRYAALVVPSHSIRYTNTDREAFNRLGHKKHYVPDYMLSRSRIIVREDVITVGYYVLFALLDAGYSEILVYNSDYSPSHEGASDHSDLAHADHA